MKPTLQDAYQELTDDGPLGLPAADVVDWFDRHLRGFFFDSVARAEPHASDLDLSELWSILLLKVYEQNMTGRTWHSLDHVIAWSLSLARGSFRYMLLERRNTFTAEGTRYAVHTLSQIEQEELERKIEFAARTKPEHHNELGASVNWLAGALDKLTPRQQQVVGLTVVGDYRLEEVAEITGTTVSTVERNKGSALYRLATASPYLDLKRIDASHPYVQMARGQMTPEQRSVFDLCVLQGMTEARAAAELGVHPNALSVSKQRAVLKLAAFMDVRGREGAA